MRVEVKLLKEKRKRNAAFSSFPNNNRNYNNNNTATTHSQVTGEKRSYTHFLLLYNIICMYVCYIAITITLLDDKKIKWNIKFVWQKYKDPNSFFSVCIVHLPLHNSYGFYYGE